MNSRIVAIKGIKLCITQQAIRPTKLGALAQNKKHPTQDGSDLHLTAASSGGGLRNGANMQV